MAGSLNVEKLFLSKVIHDGEFKYLSNMDSDYFAEDGGCRDAFEYIRDYYAQYGSVPTPRLVRADVPKFALASEVEESWEYLREKVEAQYRRGYLQELLDPFKKAFDSGNIDEALNVLGSAVSEMHQIKLDSRDVDVTSNGSERLARYIERANNPGVLVGVPTGFPTIDKATQGLQNGQFVVVTGLAKASKSTAAMLIAMAVQEYNKKVLYCTYEQTVEEQEQRLDAYRAGFNDNKLNSGELTSEDMRKLEKAIAKTESLPEMWISEDCMTVSSIAAKIDAFEPDIVIVDGVYMMEDERGEPPQSAAALTNIVRGLKFLAMRRNICIIGVTQSTPARSKGEVLNHDSIMGSRAFVQYANVGIGIERTDDVGVRKLRILFSRSCAPCEVMLKFDYDTGEFVEIEDWDGDDWDDDEEGNEENYQGF